MTLDEARGVIRAASATFTEKVEAVAVISTSSDATWRDLVECLSVKGYGAEMAAGYLHRKTGRPWKRGEGFVTDPDDWRRFLDQTIPGWSAPPPGQQQ